MGTHAVHGLALLAALAGGCSKSDSGDILTSGMYGSITARADGDGKTRVSTTLFLGNPLSLNFIELSDDDRLVVRHAGQEVTPTEGDILNIVSYTATFPTEAADEMFEVAFLRTVDAGAPSSIATLPAPFALTGTIPVEVSRAQAHTITWAPGGSTNSMHAMIDGTCVDVVDLPITGDPGTFTIPPNTIKRRTPQQGENIPDTCAVEIRIERRREGVLDSHFGKGGSVQGIQSRKETFTSKP